MRDCAEDNLVREVGDGLRVAVGGMREERRDFLEARAEAEALQAVFVDGLAGDLHGEGVDGFELGDAGAVQSIVAEM